MIVGLNGLKGSGKDTVGEYLERAYGFTRASFAALLKKSAAALFDIDVDLWEKLKNDDRARVRLYRTYDSDGVPNATEVYADMSVREFLQRYGTEAHRDVFGDNFWVDALFSELGSTYYGPDIVITDTRFENEITAVWGRDGVVVQIDRGLPAVDGHRSEILPAAVDARIRNQGDFEQLYAAVDEWATRMGLKKVTNV